MDIDNIVQEVMDEINARAGIGGAPVAENNREGASSPAKYIDRAIVNADATIADVQRVCDESKRRHIASVCVNSSYIKYVSECLSGTDVKPCCAVGFPLGAMMSSSKANEASDAASAGAKEIDMVINIGASKSGDWKLVHSDIEDVVGAVRGRAIVKVIIEVDLLVDEEKVKACAAAKMAGAHFVATSTGFSGEGAKIEDIRLIKQTVGSDLGVKASGGTQSNEDMIEMINAGASRIGQITTAAVAT
jgi:deoxyribose-phosphate aldolase